jgi:hypothetical protein
MAEAWGIIMAGGALVGMVGLMILLNAKRQRQVTGKRIRPSWVPITRVHGVERV